MSGTQGEARLERWDRKIKYMSEALIIESDFYETLSDYRPDNDIRRFVEEVLPDTWRIKAENVWQHCSPPKSDLIIQGWKIHISATPLNLHEIVEASIPVIAQHGTAFKFAADRFIFSEMNSKRWSRGGSGKFMTVYPADEEAFKHLIQALYEVLKDFSGPYILSDKRYKDCKVLYYRYGGVASLSSLDPSGQELSFLVAPNGSKYEDIRTPYFNPPPWAVDPFPTEDVDEELVLDNGRFLVLDCLSYSNTGGVYQATDTTTGETVVVKEARPFIDVGMDGADVTNRLEKEHRVLERLKSTGLTAKPLSLFYEWEHRFLAQQLIEGETLSDFVGQRDITLKASCTPEDVAAWFNELKCVVINLANAIQTVHAHGIIVGDLSLGNVLIDPSTLEVKLIDLEGASEMDSDERSGMFTYGFTPKDRSQRNTARLEDDLYALGALILAFCTPAAILAPLHADAPAKFLDAILKDFGLDLGLKKIVLRLLSEKEDERPGLDEVVECFRALKTVPEIKHHCQKPSKLVSLNRSIAQYILSTASFDRTDRLFPNDIEAKNPLSIDHGALGVVYVLKHLLGNVPKDVMRWINSRLPDFVHYVPGLYNGTSGMAWVLSVLGQADDALELLDNAYHHPLLYQASGLGTGAAGVGLSHLNQWYAIGNENSLLRAEVIARTLNDFKQENERGDYWPSFDGTTYVGYMQGASGIALFFLHLHVATGKPVYLQWGRRALAFDLSYATLTEENYLSFPEETNFRSIIYPYLAYGSAGVGTTLLRYYAFTGDPEYGNMLLKLLPDVTRKYTIFPGLFNGLAGLGNFLLDYHQFTGESEALDACNRVYEGIELFAIAKETGTAFPGDHLLRISTDLATGSAGIALFSHRLASQSGNLNFCLDEPLRAAIEAATSESRTVRLVAR